MILNFYFFKVCLFFSCYSVFYHRGLESKNSEGQRDNYFPPRCNPILTSSARLHCLLVLQQALGLKESLCGEPTESCSGKGTRKPEEHRPVEPCGGLAHRAGGISTCHSHEESEESVVCLPSSSLASRVTHFTDKFAHRAYATPCGGWVYCEGVRKPWEVHRCHSAHRPCTPHGETI